MPPVPALRGLARVVVGEPRPALRRLLTLVCERLAMDVAFVTVLDDAGTHVVRMSARGDGSLGPEDLPERLDTAWCDRVVSEGCLVVQDSRVDGGLRALPSTAAFGIVSFAGVPVHTADGDVLGTLCVFGHAPRSSLAAHDQAALAGLAEVVAGPLVQALDSPAPRPAPAPAGTLAAVASAVEGAHDVERLTRPLLDALGELTGLASTCLTVVHEDDGVQEIRYAQNTRAGFELPEGLLVPWADTLCKRALDEGRPYITDVPGVWGDSDTGRSLGIQVYASVPVELPGGEVWGTLCAADSVPAAGVGDHLPTMRLFARLIAAEVEREAVMKQVRRNADSDALTRCASRRVVQPWLATQISSLTPDEVVLVGYLDLDRFTEVNDVHGHGAGDAVLVEVGHRLRAVARPHDLVARLGGDEFLVAARVPSGATGPLTERVRSALAFAMPWQDTLIEVRASIGFAVAGHEDDGPSVVAAADAAMYAEKNATYVAAARR